MTREKNNDLPQHRVDYWILGAIVVIVPVRDFYMS